jgi:hypothetical protein
MAESGWNIVIGGACMAIRPVAAVQDAGFRNVITTPRESRLARAEERRHMPCRMQKISAPHGTHIEIGDNVGIMRL